ncbi:proprotein convertase subtilisin/kexin type 6-like [Mercenaria mercenaria]|uniref:proprotein convertase subtilisin/kexin type 6-like n=1 Tax=Mercenaria mercenaria TaxID=6596 RepID=UPI00234F54CC|nr:proprotein convertase subtilisin/kexin type 6-like [Mercenaria mercenaria]
MASKVPLAYFFLVTLNFIIFKNVDSYGGPKGYYSNEWLLKTNGGQPGAKSLAENNGFQILAELSGGYFVLRRTEIKPPTRKQDAPIADLSRHSQVEYLHQLRYLNRTAKSTFPDSSVLNDSYWPQMWHVHDDTFPSMGVYGSWRRGFSGNGIAISVLDDGVEPDHPDLVGNYDETRSYDYLSNSSYVNHTGTDYHGTLCAGISSAVMNDECVLGMAYMSKFAAVKIFDTFYGLTDFGESLALVHDLARTDIYSNSWGPIDTGDIFAGPGELAKIALKQAVNEGRNGLGAIYTWAAGNGGIYDDCNCDGYANSIYTISVTSIGRDQALAFYSEECSSVMVGTYSGDSPDLTIASTFTDGGCTDLFQGTSASCPMAAGIIALVLEANPTLSWRDVQHLIVETSTRDGLITANWQTNGAGYKVSHGVGFGMMNAEAMLDAALNWRNVPAQVMCESEMVVVNRSSNNGVYVISEHESDGCSGSVQYLEHVEVTMTFQATYRGSMQMPHPGNVHAYAQ